MAKKFHVINWGPLQTNVLDKIGSAFLQTSRGDPVWLTRSGGRFIIRIGTQDPFVTDDNIRASYYLNQNEVGEES